MNAVTPQADKAEPSERDCLRKISAIHEKRWHVFLDRIAEWLSAERGRAAALSRHLGVSRQSVSRWFGPERHFSNCPAWAAVAANIYYFAALKAEQQKLQEQIHLNLVTPQADKRRLQLVRGSADKLPFSATPQPEKVPVGSQAASTAGSGKRLHSAS